MEMDVLRSLFRELGYPSADKLWAAARRKGLKDVTKSDAVAVVRSQNSRQVFAARPGYTGKIVATRLDDRWDADLIDYTATPSKSSDSEGKPYKYILIVQDVFSRRIWAVSLRENNQEVVTQAFEHIVRQAKDKPDELDTDQGPSSRASSRTIWPMSASHMSRRTFATRMREALWTPQSVALSGSWPSYRRKKRHEIGPAWSQGQ